MSTQTPYKTATVTVRQHHQNTGLWGVTWKAGSEWSEIKDRLKELLWAFDYKYDANNKCWVISKEYTKQLEHTLIIMFPLENINWPGNSDVCRAQADAQGERRRQERAREHQSWRASGDDSWRQSRRQYEDRQRQYSTPNNTQTTPYAVLMVTQSAPLGLCEAAYRWWSKELHPDKGGDVEKMKVINNAIAEIRRVKGK